MANQDLSKQVEQVLQKHTETSNQQARQITEAVRLVDDLVKRGLAEPPTYKLAANSAPAFAKFK